MWHETNESYVCLLLKEHYSSIFVAWKENMHAEVQEPGALLDSVCHSISQIAGFWTCQKCNNPIKPHWHMTVNFVAVCHYGEYIG